MPLSTSIKIARPPLLDFILSILFQPSFTWSFDFAIPCYTLSTLPHRPTSNALYIGLAAAENLEDTMNLKSEFLVYSSELDTFH